MKKQCLMIKIPAFYPLRNFTIASACLALLLSFPAAAQEQNTQPAVQGVVDILPVQTLSGDNTMPDESTSTHPTLRMTPDKSELIRLPRNAGTIVVGNPAHVNVIADSSKTLVIVPRLPGATYFTVLDSQGDIIMQRHVIVASPQANYVRVRRTCAGDVEGCQNTSVFYCPDMCHEILISGEAADSGKSSSGGDNGGIADVADSMDNVDSRAQEE